MGEGRGNAFIGFRRREEEEIARCWKLQKRFGNFRGNYTGRPSRSPITDNCTMDSGCESFWQKMIGKPYSGKPNVRFDEGELEIEPMATTPALYSTPDPTLLINGRRSLKRGLG